MNDTTRNSPRKLTPPEVARRYGVSPEKVLGWIKSGELRAVNVATRREGRKPRYRIDEGDLLAFEAARAPQPAPPMSRRRRHRPQSVIEFF